MNIFQKVIQKILEKVFLFFLNIIYKIKFKKISFQKIKNNNQKIKFSIILPTFNSDPKYLSKCLDSVINQTYKNWELCVSDDGSSNQTTINVLNKYSKNKKIKIVLNKNNQNISINSNSAAKLATGDYLCLLDHDDLLWPNALAEISKLINKDKDLKFIYSDQDKILEEKHLEPFLKPDFDKNLIKSVNYFNHFTIIKKSTFNQLKGFKKGTEGAQDWDLYLRMLKIIKPKEIYHIKKILYSWRISPSSTAGNINKNYAYKNQEKILKLNFPKNKIKKTPYLGIWQIDDQKYPLPYQLSLKSLINLLSL